MRPLLLLALLVGCAPGGPVVVSVGEAQVVVPGPGLPVVPQDANNNLSVIDHDGALFFAWRTAPTHFASAQAQMHVIRSDDDGSSWALEATFELGADVREPQLVSHDGWLRLYFAELGVNPLAFEPAGTWTSRRAGPGDWGPIESVFDDTFIPWRIRSTGDRVEVFGYSGGENIYDFANREPIQIRWLASDDGLAWGAAVPGQEIVLEGGGSETDAAVADDGTLVAVVRNEAGDEQGFGSLICTAPPASPGDWTCDHDPKKYDSPLVFAEAGRVWLIGRRNVTDDGAFDLGHTDEPPEDLYLRYQFDYWQHPKRCALWSIDPANRTVTWELDLPSRGDTCFPDERSLGDGVWDIWNYTSPLDGGDPGWQEGQVEPTSIYRIELRFD